MTGEISDEPPDGEWRWSPAPPDMETYVDVGDVTVDGETFVVRRRDGDGSYHYDWVTGPNKDYGFSLGSHLPLDFTVEQHEEQIRDFLAGIDPATGYLAD
ncbi:hypothetical protein [Microbacterium sp. MPKO10]|uniref:hypothetical protein n=1 Tax=Microbacterium sp. MPKO10 TaxID=2989818 RepID=UPI0022354E3D|nr:hypothetical protein [Microbacterium sp. MPKO10]MCW4459279.1 hypothetical protein [Microbacterium sp. MPKO10]